MGSLESLVGERLMIGLQGPVASDADLRLFEETGASGLILYRRNFEHPDQLLGLLERLESALERRLLVATDQEGGRIVMLGGGVTIFPDNLALGRGGDETLAYKQGLIEGRELSRLGVDLNLGPCLDVLGAGYSPNIGIRSYGEDPAAVSRLGTARIRGTRAGGVASCAKHFPGQGHSPLDAHQALPVLGSSWEQMRATHLVPFRAAIEAGVECVMSSHPVYPELDPPGVPATFSERIIRGLLRDELGFRGVIVSDDLEMGAVQIPIGEAAVRAARAGHDLLLVCHTPTAQRSAARALVEAYRAGALDPAELEASAARLRSLRERPRAGGSPHAEPEGAALAAQIATRGVTILKPGPAQARLQGRTLVVFPRFSALAPRITIEPELCDEPTYLRAAFARAGVSDLELALVGVEPTAPEIEAARDAARAADRTVLFLYDAHLYPSNRALLDTLQSAARALVVVLLRDPWDASLVAPGVLTLTAYGFRRCQLDAVIARLGA